MKQRRFLALLFIFGFRSASISHRLTDFSRRLFSDLGSLGLCEKSSYTSGVVAIRALSIFGFYSFVTFPDQGFLVLHFRSMILSVSRTSRSAVTRTNSEQICNDSDDSERFAGRLSHDIDGALFLVELNSRQRSLPISFHF